MARKRTSRKGVMEWVTETSLQTTVDTNTLTVIDLDLNPDEIAEIIKIRTMLRAVIEQAGTAQDLGIIGMCLSTDPSADINPLGVTAATMDDLEDEEIFLFHRVSSRFVWGTDVGFVDINEYHEWTDDFCLGSCPPLLVGRNIGFTTRYTETTAQISAIEGYCQVYFKRRKGSPDEILNLIKH
jgi:hypothetical protein